MQPLHKYLFSDTSSGWVEAWAECELLGGWLVHIGSQQEQNCLLRSVALSWILVMMMMMISGLDTSRTSMTGTGLTVRTIYYLCFSLLSPLSQPTWRTPQECSSTRPTTTRSPGSAPSGSTATGTPWHWASGPGHCMIRKMEAGRTFPHLTGIATFVKHTCEYFLCSKL